MNPHGYYFNNRPSTDMRLSKRYLKDFRYATPSEAYRMPIGMTSEPGEHPQDRDRRRYGFIFMVLGMIF